MKVIYKSVDGTKSEVEVNEGLGSVINNIEKEESLRKRRSTRRNCSFEEDLHQPINEKPNDIDIDLVFENYELHKEISSLSKKQKDLIYRVFFYGQELKEVASKDETTYQAIQNRLFKIMNRLEKELSNLRK